jgi:enoyl-CoA hydratase/carnithine racemase
LLAERIATIALNDPARRNALGLAMFDGLAAALDQVATRDDAQVALLHGVGKAFCAGFDLAAAVDDHALLGEYIGRLSAITRRMRRMPQVVIAAAHGAVIAGGCALISAADIVVVSRTATLGYPVHRIGISPAVTLPTLLQALPPGTARQLVIGGQLIDGTTAHGLGLAHQLSASDDRVLDDARALAERIASYGGHGLRVTKDWINQLDQTLDDARFDAPAQDSAAKSSEAEARQMLQTFWAARTADRV